MDALLIIEVSLVGLLSASMAGITGVGGGLLMVPGLIMIGIDPMIAVATGSAITVVTKASGAIGHWREGNIDKSALKIIMIVSGLATLALAGGFSYLLMDASAEFQKDLKGYLKIVVGVVVFFAALLLLKELVSGKGGKEQSFPYKRLKWLSVVPGGSVGLTGVGGGALMVPLLLLLGMEASVAAGTALAGGTFLSGLTALIYGFAAKGFNFELLLFAIPAVVFGGIVGAKISHKVPEMPLKWATCAILGVMSVNMMLGSPLKKIGQPEIQASVGVEVVAANTIKTN